MTSAQGYSCSKETSPFTAGSVTASMLGMMLVLALLPGHTLKAQGFPDPALLEALKTRLTEPANCLPRSAEIARAKLSADPGKLRLAAYRTCSLLMGSY